MPCVPTIPRRPARLLKEAGYDERRPLQFTIITDNEKRCLPTSPSLLKEQYKKLGVETKVEVQDKVTWMTYMVGKNRCQWDHLGGGSGVHPHRAPQQLHLGDDRRL